MIEILLEPQTGRPGGRVADSERVLVWNPERGKGVREGVREESSAGRTSDA
jgi:hypothetical protein